MKIFLTGGTGFVGGHFINEAHARGYEIIALRRPGSGPRILLNKEPKWVDGQLNGDYMLELVGVDVMVHLASHTPNPPYDSLSQCLYWNVFASLQLAEQALKSGVKKFLVSGSCFEYGNSSEKYLEIPPSAPLSPNLSYPTSKAAASTAFAGFAAENNLKLKILRFFQVYGEGEQDTRFWPSLKKAALAGSDFEMSQGEQVRDFIHVNCLVKKVVDQLNFEGTQKGVPYFENIGLGAPQTLKEFAQHWWREWGATGNLKFGVLPYRKNEIMRLVPKVVIKSQKKT